MTRGCRTGHPPAALFGSFQRACSRAAIAASAGIWVAVTAEATTYGEAVDLQLIIAVDVSPSMSKEEQQIQRDGYVSAFRSPELVRAISTGEVGRIVVTYVEWAGPRHQHVAMPWTVIGSYEEAEQFADGLEVQPLSAGSGTSISGMFAQALEWFGEAPFLSQRKTIDVSGDGINNTGPLLSPVRDVLLSNGITINGLPIALRRDHDDNFHTFDRTFITAYFDDCVIGGPESFVIPVGDPSELEAAIRVKLIREIAGSNPLLSHASFRQKARAQTNCIEVGREPGR